MKPGKDHEKPARKATPSRNPPNERLGGCPSSTVSHDDDITPCLDRDSTLAKKPDNPSRPT